MPWGGVREGSGRKAVGDDIRKKRTLCLSDKEWEKIKILSKNENKSVGEYIRSKLLSE
jgi:hypothetical protein